MRLTPQLADRVHKLILLCICTVIIISGLSAIYAAKQEDQRIRSELQKNSEIAAAALDATKVMRLYGTSHDEGTANYTDLKQELHSISSTDPDIRSIYLTGERAGRLFFYVDSEKPESRDYSPAGEYYDDSTPEFKGIFSTKKTVVEGPVTDDFGTFISGLAPIFDPISGRVVAVLGIDVASSTYYRDIAMATVIPILTGLIVIVIIFFFEAHRRRNAQLMVVKSELVSVASHELRTPLTGIRWAASSLEPLVSDENGKKLAKTITNSVEQLQASTDDILELSHALNHRKLRLAPTNVTTILREVANTQHLSAQQKGVVLERDPSWPAELTLNCDATMMKRVFYNLVSNAIKYTRPNTTIVFSSELKKNMRYLHITDQGIGIPKEEQTKIFKGFYRATNAVASNIPGTGMGLYLVKTVVEQHGGTVHFTSEENKGTTITLCFPV